MFLGTLNGVGLGHGNRGAGHAVFVRRRASGVHHPAGAFQQGIGGFDADKIQGDSLELGIGHAEEPFEGIGRGTLNIEGLPVYRDRAGGIGTPTSDNERTKMGLETRRILAIVNGYNGREGLAEAAGMIQELLRKYADSDGETILYFE